MAEPLHTHYDLLQVQRHASAENIRQAYRKLVHKYHPDKTPGDADAVRAMAAINAAYQVLSDAHQRAEYDLQLSRAEQQSRSTRQPAAKRPSFWARISPVAQWPWYVLGATMVLALGTIGTAIYMSAAPVRAASAQPEQSAPPAKKAKAAAAKSSQRPQVPTAER